MLLFGEKVRKGVKKFAALCLECLHCSRRWLQKRERYTPLSARVADCTGTRADSGLHADLAAQIGSHRFFDGFFRVTAVEEVVQFGDSGFGGHVAAADGAGCVQMAEEFLTAMVQ